MRARSRLTCRPRKLPPSPAARAAIAQIKHMLTNGCSAAELAQARASLDALNTPRQPQLTLRLKP